MELRNWAGNTRFSTDRVHHPETVGEVQEIVRTSRQVRVLGSRHSFNAIADSSGDLISLDRLTHGDARLWQPKCHPRIAGGGHADRRGRRHAPHDVPC